jgi:hypothetical protein
MPPTERTPGLYELSTGVRSTRNDDGGIILDLSHGKIFRLNGIGAFIFERIRDRQNETEIIAEVSHTYGIPNRIIHSDVTDFLKSLERQGLVMVRQGPADDSQNG